MKKGFSMVELLMAVGLFAVVGTTVSVLLVTSLRGARTAAAVGGVKTEGQYAMNSMLKMIKYATTATCTTGTSLRISRINGDVVDYLLSGTRVASQSGAVTVNLTTPSVRVTLARCGGVMFTCPDAQTVEICFDIDSANSQSYDPTSQAGGNGGINFMSTVGLRNLDN